MNWPPSYEAAPYTKWEANRSHIEGLHPDFTNAEIALAWASWLINPAMMGQGSEFGPVPPDGTPVQDLSLDRFFDDAHALTGPEVHSCEPIYNICNAVWWEIDDGEAVENPGSGGSDRGSTEQPKPTDGQNGINAYSAAMTHILAEWQGQAAIDATAYIGAIVGYVNNQRDCLMGFGKAVLAYAGIIEAARQSLNDLMGTFAEACSLMEASDDLDLLQFGIAIFTSILPAVGKLTTLASQNAQNGFASAMGSLAIDSLGKVPLNAQTANFKDIANAYMAGSRRTMQDAGEAIQKVHDDMKGYLDNLPPALAVPPTVSQIPQNPGSFEPEGYQPPSGVRDPGPSLKSSAISRRLAP